LDFLIPKRADVFFDPLNVSVPPILYGNPQARTPALHFVTGPGLPTGLAREGLVSLGFRGWSRVPVGESPTGIGESPVLPLNRAGRVRHFEARVLPVHLDS
jgi:hypothetical protein